MATTSTRPRGSISIQVFLVMLVVAVVGAELWRKGAAVPTATAQDPDEAPGAAGADGRERVEIGAVVPGVVASVLVEPGDEVRAGDVLARLDDRAEVAARDRARAALEIAETQRAQLERRLADDVTRADDAVARVEQDLAGLAAVELEAGVIPSSERALLERELERARALRDEAAARADDVDDPARRILEARRLEAAAALREAELAVEQRIITAPLDGRVVGVAVRPGAMIAASAPVVVVEASTPPRRPR